MDTAAGPISIEIVQIEESKTRQDKAFENWKLTLMFAPTLETAQMFENILNCKINLNEIPILCYVLHAVLELSNCIFQNLF